MNLKELFQNKKTALTDGATGTYFSKLTGLSPSLCEKYNSVDNGIIQRIYQDYIDAGADMIRTNTFSANSFSLGITRSELKSILVNAYCSAKECAKDKAVVCANVSAVYDTEKSAEEISDEYRFIIDTFLSCGAETFIFETLPGIEMVMPAIDYIIECKPSAEIIVSFTVLPDGRTRSGLSLHTLLQNINENKSKLTAAGLNCGCGAVQMFANAVPFLSYIHKNTDLYTLLMPNSGYPAIENNRTVFTSTPFYFAEQVSRFLPYGVSAVGGCCGTEPEYISVLSQYVNKNNIAAKNIHYYEEKNKKKAAFSSQLAENKFIIAAELDPPNNADFTKIISAAKTLKDAGVNIITISDSPLGHAKADPVICSARIKREVDIETLPHICCRDRNLNALRSILLGAHSEGIRAVLAVTGDHIAETDRGIIKPVFNVDSVRLMELISRLNDDVFADFPIAIGGAYDPEERKTLYSLKRAEKKKNAGAKFLLTQPVFSEESISSLQKARESGLKVLVGIMPMVSYRNACFMKNEVPGMVIPQELVDRFSPDMTKEKSTKTGVEIAVEIARKLRPYADGFYFVTPFNRAEVIAACLKELKDII